MNMAQWLLQTFGPGDGTDIQIAVVVAADGPPGAVTCDAAWLAGELGSAVPPTYAGLSALPMASPQSGNWQWIFDQWKARGYVS